jgi:hypothetical protein
MTHLGTITAGAHASDETAQTLGFPLLLVQEELHQSGPNSTQPYSSSYLCYQLRI